MKTLMSIGLALMTGTLAFVLYQWMETRATLETLKRRLDAGPVEVHVIDDRIPSRAVGLRDSLLQREDPFGLRPNLYLDELRRANDIQEQRAMDEERDRIMKRYRLNR